VRCHWGTGLSPCCTACFLSSFPGQSPYLRFSPLLLLCIFFSPVNNCRLVAVLLVAQPHLHPGCQAQTEALKTAPFASVSDRLVSQTTISRASQHGMAMVTSILWVLCGCALPSYCLISCLPSSPSQVGIWRGYVEPGRIKAASGRMGHWRFLPRTRRVIRGHRTVHLGLACGPDRGRQ
jgi:hypothetical protein